MALIEFEGLHMRYRGAGVGAVLAGASGHVSRGEFVVVLGRSGSGKSTLLNLLGGLDRPSAGWVRFDGQSLFTLSDAALTRLRRARMGVIFQSFNLVPTLTAVENLRLPLALNRVADDGRAASWLARVGLGDRAAAWPEQLSGGEQQRLAVARALIHEPEVILADEPTGNLDIDNARAVVALLDGLCREAGRTLVMVTHSREVAGLADRLLTIRGGRLMPVAD